MKTNEQKLIFQVQKHLNLNKSDFKHVYTDIQKNGNVDNYFIYTHGNLVFLKKNKNLINKIINDFYEEIGYEENFKYRNNELENDTIKEIKGFIYGNKIPNDSMSISWIVWASIEICIMNMGEN